MPILLFKKKNVHQAKLCIAKCKQSKQNKTWLYSEAFLSAYSGQAPSTICAKYRKALEIPYNLVDIADYIEFILENEPEKMTLHLAAGLIYEAIGDSRLMKMHFSIFLEHLDKKQDKVKPVLIS